MLIIPHLETDLTVACQLSCCACNHFIVPWRKYGVWKAEPKQIEKDLNHLSSILHTYAWGALGGEPLLHPDIVDILLIARESGIADKIEVWTNGLLLHKMPLYFWSYPTPMDVIVLSVYEDKHDDKSLNWIRDKCKDNGIDLEIKDERTWHNFRSNLEEVPTDEDGTKLKFDNCFFRQFSRVASQGYFYTCCCSPNIPILLQGKEKGTDGVLIEGLTEQELNDYLTRSEPLGCCSICAGRETAKEIKWSEERDHMKWIEKSKGRML